MPTASNATTKYPAVNWPELVRKIKSDHPPEAEAGSEELYQVFGRGIRYYLCRALGPQELEDKLHDTFLIVVRAIRRGDLREEDRLMGFVRTIVRRQVAAYIDTAVHERNSLVSIEQNAEHVCVPDPCHNPEITVQRQQERELMAEALGALAKRDREILVRFYLEEQPEEKIRAEMGLTETQFRLIKSRAKAKFGEIGKRKLKENKNIWNLVQQQFSPA